MCVYVCHWRKRQGLNSQNLAWLRENLTHISLLPKQDSPKLRLWPVRHGWLPQCHAYNWNYVDFVGRSCQNFTCLLLGWTLFEAQWCIDTAIDTMKRQQWMPSNQSLLFPLINTHDPATASIDTRISSAWPLKINQEHPWFIFVYRTHSGLFWTAGGQYALQMQHVGRWLTSSSTCCYRV